MRKPLFFLLILVLAPLRLCAAEENEQVSRFERAALNRESAAESYRLESEQMAKDSDYLANSLAPSATNFFQRLEFVDSAGLKYDKAGDLMILARQQYLLALSNWASAQRDYHLWEDAEQRRARARAKMDESRMDAFRCAGLAADYYEAAAEQYGDVDKFEQQGVCFSKAAFIVEEIAKERPLTRYKKMVTVSPTNDVRGAP